VARPSVGGAENAQPEEHPVSTVPSVPMPDRDAVLAAGRRAALHRARRLGAGARAAAMLAAAEAGHRS